MTKYMAKKKDKNEVAELFGAPLPRSKEQDRLEAAAKDLQMTCCVACNFFSAPKGEPCPNCGQPV